MQSISELLTRGNNTSPAPSLADAWEADIAAKRAARAAFQRFGAEWCNVDRVHNELKAKLNNARAELCRAARECVAAAAVSEAAAGRFVGLDEPLAVAAE
jgi:hypothetical protein